MSRHPKATGTATAASLALGVALQGTHVSHNVAIGFYALAGLLLVVTVVQWWMGKGDASEGDPPWSISGRTSRSRKTRAAVTASVSTRDNSTALVKPTLQIVAPQPGLDVKTEYENQPNGDKFQSRLHLRVRDGYAANGLRVEVTGQTISDELLVMPFDPTRPGILTGSFQSPQWETTPGRAVFQFAGALRPEYIVEVQTREQTR